MPLSDNSFVPPVVLSVESCVKVGANRPPRRVRGGSPPIHSNHKRIALHTNLRDALPIRTRLLPAETKSVLARSIAREPSSANHARVTPASMSSAQKEK